ncbi:MAG TPA: hypothetical protein VEQ58_05995 [Polyangiaceae bacterium]|nr:hypothetical protein [Polyangiaceae bacterium]
MNALKTVSRAIAACSLVGLIATQASATCDTGKQPFPGVNKLAVKNLACGGAKSKHNVENIGGSKRVFVTLNVGTRSARTNGITSSNQPIAGCFAEDRTAGNGGAGDTSGCQAAAFWIGTLFT